MPLTLLRLPTAALAIGWASAPLVALGVPALAGAATLSSPHAPHARPAMQGARPRNHPVAPMIQGSGSVIMHEISDDAQSSGVLLLILLVPITLYGLSIRQRDRREVQAPTTRSLPEPVTSGHGSMLADPLLEFFGPQHARPADRK